MQFESSFTPPTGWAPESAGLTVTQLAAIGFVMTTWATLETIYQHTLFVLAQSPDMLGQALTEDLSPDNRSKAMKRLCASWKLALGDRFPEQTEALDKALEITKWIDTNKAERNHLAHWNWLRNDDESMFGFKYHLKPVDLSDNRPRGALRKHEDVFKFGTEIARQAGALLELQPAFDALPSWPQKQHAPDQGG